MTDPTSFAGRIVGIHDALDKAGLAHAFGGALALAYYAIPRITTDVDVNVFVGLDRRDAVERALAPLEVRFGERAIAERDGWERAFLADTPVDVFYAYDPFHDAMAQQTRLFPFGATSLPFLAPEHLAACKAIFAREKDWPDLDQLLIVTTDLDIDETVRWIAHVVGPDDWRLARFRAAVKKHGDERLRRG